MKSKTTGFLFILVIAVGCYIWFVERGLEGTRSRELAGRQAFPLVSGQLSYIRIERENLVFECEKGSDRNWTIHKPYKGRADFGEIQRLIASLEELDRLEIITSDDMRARSQRLSDFGLTRPRYRLTLGDPRRKVEYILGRKTPVGDGVYVREGGASDIWTTKESLTELLDIDHEAIRDRVLIQGDIYDVSKLELSSPDGFIQLVHDESDGWLLTQPVTGRAASPVVTDIIGQILDLRALGFVADEVADDTVYGLADGQAVVSLYAGIGELPQTLTLGSSNPGQADELFAKVSGDRGIYTVASNILTTARTDLSNLRDRRLIHISAFEIREILIRGQHDLIELQRTASNNWVLIRPRQWAADDEVVESFLETWSVASVVAFRDDVATEEAEQLLKESPLSIEFGVKGSATDPSRGSEKMTICDEGAADGNTLVYVESRAHFYEVPNYLSSSLRVNPLYFKSKVLLSLDRSTVRSVAVEQGDRRWSVAMDDEGVFRPEMPDDIEINVSQLGALLAAMERLRAEAFVLETDRASSAYGLRDPSCVITLGLTGDQGISRTISLGSEAPEGGYYGAIRGQEGVFILSEKTVRVLTRPILSKKKQTNGGGGERTSQ